MEFANVLDLVKGVFMNPDNASRQANEKQLSMLIDSQPDYYATKCAEEFQKESTSPAVRALMSTALKMTIQFKKGEKKSAFWSRLQPATKDAIKMAGLQAYIDKSLQVRSAAANLISIVFVADFVSDRRYLDLLTAICANIQNEDLKVREASMQTFGAICELLAQQKVTNFDQGSYDQLVTGIILGLKNTDSTTQTAVKALSDSIDFLNVKLQNEQFMEFMYQQLITFMKAAVSSHDWKLFQTIVLCLGHVMKAQYKAIDRFAPIIISELAGVLNTLPEMPLLNLVELFIKLLRLEAVQPKGYFKDSALPLVSVVHELFKHRLATNTDPEDELASSLLELIRAVNKIFIEQTYAGLMKFVQDNWESDNEVLRVASICTLDSVVASTPSMTITDALNQAFIWILNCVKHGSSLRVSLRALDLIELIVTHQAQVIFTDINFYRLVEDFMLLLQTPAPSEIALKLKIAVAVCFDQVIEQLSEKKSYLTTVRAFSSQIQQAIFKAFDSEKSYRFLDALLSILFDFSRFVLTINQLSDFFSKILLIHEKILHEYNGESKQMLYECCLFNMNTILGVLRSNNQKLVLKGKDAVSELKTLVENMNTVFSNGQQALPAGIYTMTEVFLMFPTEFQGNVRHFYEHYLKPGLADLTMPETVNTCVKCFFLLYLEFKSQFEDLIGPFVQYAIIMLGNSDLEQSLRVPLFDLLSDVAVNIPNALEPYLTQLFELIKLAFSAVIFLQTNESNNKESMLFSNKLREALLQLAECIIIGLYQPFPNYDTPIEEKMVEIQIALKQVIETSPIESYELVLRSLYLINDFYYKKRSEALVDRAFAKQLWAYLQQKPSKEVNELSEYLESTKLIN